MPRAKRQFEIGGVYHVMNRGVEKRDIFLKPQDYSRFTVALEFFNRPNANDLWVLLARGGSDPPQRERLENERKKPYERLVDILAYTLMPNHFHLILKEIIDGGVSLFMGKLGGYAGYFNKQYKRVGPLFQSRYKAVRVTTDAQLMTVFHYVHANSIELPYPSWKEDSHVSQKQLLSAVAGYQWSSYQDYLGSSQTPSIIQKEFCLNVFGGRDRWSDSFKDWIVSKSQRSSVLPEFLE